MMSSPNESVEIKELYIWNTEYRAMGYLITKSGLWISVDPGIYSKEFRGRKERYHIY